MVQCSNNGSLHHHQRATLTELKNRCGLCRGKTQNSFFPCLVCCAMFQQQPRVSKRAVRGSRAGTHLHQKSTPRANFASISFKYHLHTSGNSPDLRNSRSELLQIESSKLVSTSLRQNTPQRLQCGQEEFSTSSSKGTELCSPPPSLPGHTPFSEADRTEESKCRITHRGIKLLRKQTSRHFRDGPGFGQYPIFPFKRKQ